ncbi:MFS transporter [Pseudobacteroides cellulosolvens]|uniref:Major facilitator superfamily MFS_1 n=1 Tax=Pseudobacteroides cellulosolvens ATCC 35603 = DSM 2933 TaxID=398512 RepID=A0A0L6JJC3_9FIRM|nr:MFS transporter [Pseudobacteroides cellulosolvens]KNY25849.1 major facilitator superfamily MFS_1 [Pseudobacteroides cellulosolvens ATCC 35603 = DSM 2933]
MKKKSLLSDTRKELKIYFAIIALTALALGFSNDIISNYFKDAYNASAYQRGLIEFPREIPGVLCIFLIAGLGFLRDIKIAILAQILSIFGIAVLGILTPSFSVMLIFIFINSLGMHLFMPLQDSIGISLTDPKNTGRLMGQFKGITTAFQMLAAILVLIGFKTGYFSFTKPIKSVFLISAGLLIIVLMFLIVLNKYHHINQNDRQNNKKKLNFVFRREYKYYYILVIMFGVQKQIMIVYGPWVLIDLLNKKADTIALLNIIGAFIGVFFIPAVGRWLDKFGIKKLLYADAFSFIGVYFLYGLLSMGYSGGTLSKVGLPVFLAYILFIIDRMSTQLGLVRTVYLRTIAVDKSDITPTLSLGLSMDHVVSIASAFVGGIIWGSWGPQYIFFFASFLSLINLYVAVKVKLK